MLESLGAPPLVAGPCLVILLGVICAALGRRLLLALRVNENAFQAWELALFSCRSVRG